MRWCKMADLGQRLWSFAYTHLGHVLVDVEMLGSWGYKSTCTRLVDMLYVSSDDVAKQCESGSMMLDGCLYARVTRLLF